MNILLILPPLFPEVVCSTALIRCLKKALPGTVLHVLVPAQFGFLVAANPHIDTLLTAHQMHTAVNAEKYNVLLDLAHLEENRRWAKKAGVKYLTFSGGFFLDKLGLLFGRAQKENLALRFVAAAGSLGVQYDGKGMDVFMSPQDIVPQHDIPTAHSAGYVVLAFGKTWPLRMDVLAHFCAQCAFPVMVAGSAEIFQTAHQLAQTDPVKVYNACGKFSDAETIDLVRRARVVIAADENWLQVAAALGKKVLVLGTGSQRAALVPPLYAQHLLQAGTPPYAVLEVPQSARFEKNGEKRLALPADAEALADSMVEAVKEHW